MNFQNLIALALVFTSSCLFGTMFVLVKKYKSSDGLFVQWIMCLGIWLVGFVMFLWTGYQLFYPLAMLGGASWCIGNLMAMPIIQELGLGLALLLFSVMNTATCFTVSTFGLLGTIARPAEHIWLTVFGMALVLVGAILGALISGILYGLNIVPIITIQDHPDMFENVKSGGMPYIFSQFCGILVTSTTAFIIYCVIKKNTPFINPATTMPALLCGVMWGVAQSLAIVATEHLSQAITGPITAMVPGCVATVWSLYYFREIETGKNLRILWAAISVTIAGAACIGLSKL